MSIRIMETLNTKEKEIFDKYEERIEELTLDREFELFCHKNVDPEAVNPSESNLICYHCFKTIGYNWIAGHPKKWNADEIDVMMSELRKHPAFTNYKPENRGL